MRMVFQEKPAMRFTAQRPWGVCGWMLFMIGLPVLTGCGTQGWILGAQRDVLFQGLDAVTVPGRPVELGATLRGEDYLKSLRDYTVLFRDADQRLLGAGKTDGDGFVAIRPTFDRTGQHVVRLALDPEELNTADVPTCESIVGVYDPDQTFVVVDLDHTVVDAGIDQVLLGDPDPLPDCVDVLNELARDYEIIFLTHRFEHLGQRSKNFLRKWNFPRAPLLMSTIREFASGSETFKTGAIDDLRALFPNVRIGIGDKISDGAAYLNNGLESFVIIQPHKLTASEKLEVADELDILGNRGHVVTGWSEIREALQAGKVYPPQAMQERLRREGGQS